MKIKAKQFNLNDLRMLAAIHHWGSLNDAAGELGVSFATVFRRLEALEKNLGKRLFERTGGAYIATAAGEELAKAGEVIVSEADFALQKVIERELQPSGLVRISLTQTMAQCLLPLVMRQCREHHQGIKLQVNVNDSLSDLSRHEVDIALRASNQPPQDLLGQRIGTIAFAVYGAQNAFVAGEVNKYLEHAWLALNEDMQSHTTMQWLSQQKLQKQVVLRSNSFLFLSAVCADGLGLTLLPCFLGDSSKRLVRVSAPIKSCEKELWLLSHPDSKKVARISMVKQTLIAGLQGLLNRIEGRQENAPNSPSNSPL